MHRRSARPATGFLALALALAIVWPALAFAQTAATAPRALTAADYARAEKFLSNKTSPLVLHGSVRPTWLPDERFWYRVAVDGGTEVILVDPARATRAPAFDHAKVAAALNAAIAASGGDKSDKPIDAGHLPAAGFQMAPDGRTVSFLVGKKRYTCGVAGAACSAADVPETDPRNGAARMVQVASPDGKLAVFIRTDNLWLRDLQSGTERALTTDGVKDFGYATDNAGWTKSETPVVRWSPDSKKIATFQQDQRGVGEMYLVETKVGHPTLHAWKYPLPGDECVTTIQRVIIHVDGPRVVRLKTPADQHRSTVTDDIKLMPGRLEDVDWSADSSQLAFVSTSRDHKTETLQIANAETGEVRRVLEEKVAAFFESGADSVNWRFLPASNEVIWFSERENWGHLYLHDARTGQVKNAITAGDGNVTRVLRVDEKNRSVYFEGVGREKGRDPYFRHLYRASFDGKSVALLTPDDGDHEVSLSPSGRYMVDVVSRPDVPPASTLRDANGTLVTALERADISRLVAAGWKPPTPIVVKARDGVTDLYGLMFTPTTLEPGKKYPIVNNIYPGPQIGSVGGRSFMPSRGDLQALAELGFVVVQIDGMGTPGRSKKFHEAYYGDMGDNTLPDQVTGMKQLAQRYPYIDIERAGIYGGSGGGYATVGAMFRYPDFFKVGVSASGNHDNRGYEDDWGEKWQGLLERKTDGASNYDSQANQNLAKNLKGKLLLAHGTMDDNVPPYNTLLVVDALIKANKDFDLVLFPNAGHGYGAASRYFTRRTWDYFVRHLLGAEPPAEYAFGR